MGRRAALAIMLALLWPALVKAANLTEATDAERPAPVVAAAELKVANRSLIVFRAVVLGEVPERRKGRAKTVIAEALDSTDELTVSVEPAQQSYLVLLGGRRAFLVAPGDVDHTEFPSTLEAAQAAAQTLRLVVSETQEARSLHSMLRATIAAALATALYVGLLWLVYFIRRRSAEHLPLLMRRHSKTLKVGETEVVDANILYPVVRRALWLVRMLVVLLLSYEWLGFVLSHFPYTRPWGESLNSYLWNVASYLFEGIVGAIPGLGVALAIFFIARGVSAFSQRVLKRLAVPGTVSWLNRETLKPTTRLTSLAIWLFALAMAYPYLPGANTDAFKGLSVLIGLMVSLGASSVIGQAAAGLILTYTGTMRPGEFVRIGEHEGTVVDLGIFTTRIRTGLGEVLTLPNSMITTCVTKNYSRTVKGSGYIVDTSVTIGYDTPWRQVSAMLLEAARRTDGILDDPTPQVFQTALSDFYPEYRLVAQAIPSQPRPRAELLNMLHAHIQDVFNEHAVQIMSPHYYSDPTEPKWVPKEKWFTAPAPKADE